MTCSEDCDDLIGIAIAADKGVCNAYPRLIGTDGAASIVIRRLLIRIFALIRPGSVVRVGREALSRRGRPALFARGVTSRSRTEPSLARPKDDNDAL